MANRERLIGALLLGNTFVNILASSLATSLLEDRLGHRAVAVTTAVMTVLILMFAEVLPKTLAIARTDRFALAVARAAAPGGGRAGARSSRRCSGWCGACCSCSACGAEDGEEPTEAAHDEIRGTVALHHQEGTVEREHRDMIGGILDLRELHGRRRDDAPHEHDQRGRRPAAARASSTR